MGSRPEEDLPGTVDEEEFEDDVELEEIDEPAEDDLVASIEGDLAPEYDEEAEDDEEGPTEVIPPEVALEDPDEASLDDVADAVGIDVEDEDDEDAANEEVLREGEFICASCHLVKGPTQLADGKRGLCVDCV